MHNRSSGSFQWCDRNVSIVFLKVHYSLHRQIIYAILWFAIILKLHLRMKDQDEQNRDIHFRARKPSVELLEYSRERLRPTLSSFPAPRDGHSPTLPDFVFPRYDYDHVFHREPDSPVDLFGSPKVPSELGHSTLLESVFNSVNYFIGIGVLGLPYAVHCSGMIAGVIFLVLIGFMFGITGHLLGRCQHKLDLSSYPDISEVRLFNCRLLHLNNKYLFNPRLHLDAREG